jgi:two-component system, cell cycle sensor histidine kinase and response regulator CckA
MTLRGGFSQFDRATVLLVEDDAVIRTLVAEALRIKLFSVIEAEDGLKALELSRSFEGTIELLVTDISLPGIDGATLSEKIVAERSGIRVLQMSGGCPEETIQNGPRVPFLQKPFQINALFSKIDEVMGRPPASSAAAGR